MLLKCYLSNIDSLLNLNTNLLNSSFQGLLCIFKEKETHCPFKKFPLSIKNSLRSSFLYSKFFFLFSVFWDFISWIFSKPLFIYFGPRKSNLEHIFAMSSPADSLTCVSNFIFCFCWRILISQSYSPKKAFIQECVEQALEY